MKNVNSPRLLFQFLLICSGVLLLILSSCSEEKEVSDFTRPNILILMADEVSFPHMSAYGTTWVNTPTFDRVATEGLLFLNAYTPNAKCAPSRAIFLTGRNSWQLEEAGNHMPYFPEKYVSFMEVLKDAGYFTGHTLKGWSPGNPGTKDGKRRELTGKAYNDRKLVPPTSEISNMDYASNFKDFLNDKPKKQPFSFWFGSIEPHRAYEFGSSITQGKNPEEITSVPAFWPDNDSVRIDLLDYALELEYFDKQAGLMLAELEKMGELENTIVIITADNGMPFPRAKGQAYEFSNHLPLAIMWPKGINKPGRKIKDFVSFLDIAPTVLEAAGLSIEDTSMQPITGQSLVEIFESEKEGQINPNRNHVLIGKERHDVGRPNDVGYPIRGIIKDGYLYIKYFETERWPSGNPETGYLNTDGGATKSVILNLRRSGENSSFWQLNFGKRMQEELYDISKDPECLENLALKPEFNHILSSLSNQLTKELTEQNDPRMFGQGELFDNYPYSNKADSAFYSRYMNGEKMNAGWVNPSDFEKKPVY